MAVVEVVVVAAADRAARAAMAVATGSGVRDKREMGMWFHVYKV